MPRSIDVNIELEKLTKLATKSSKERRQFVLRLNVEPAVLFLRDCQRQGKQPGPLLEEVVEHYYKLWDRGVHLEFPRTVLEALNQAAECAGVDREEVVRQLVTRNVASYLQQLRQERSQLEAVLEDPNKKQKKQ